MDAIFRKSNSWHRHSSHSKPREVSLVSQRSEVAPLDKKCWKRCLLTFSEILEIEFKAQEAVHSPPSSTLHHTDWMNKSCWRCLSHHRITRSNGSSFGSKGLMKWYFNGKEQGVREINFPRITVSELEELCFSPCLLLRRSSHLWNRPMRRTHTQGF